MKNRKLVAVGAVALGWATQCGAVALEERVMEDFPKLPASGICRYWVPATSEQPYLPDAYPEDGEAGWPVKIVAAKDEYEPGAFLLYATKDFGKLSFKVSDLKSEKGDVISAKELDLKTVKVWYQNGNGWYSYFQDVGKRLCPELLLHDEDLIRVDTEKQDNWARLTEKDGRVHEFWLTAPRGVYDFPRDIAGESRDDTFFCMKENFSDAPTFAGATLRKGEFKEFVLTAHVAKNVKAGVYRGTITLSGKEKGKGEGEQRIDSIPVELKVLDFVLPPPRCYFDVEKDFETRFCEYINENIVMQSNGNDRELALRQIAAIAKDFVAHGETIGVNPWGSEATAKIAEEAGFDMRKSHFDSMPLGGERADTRLAAKHLARRLDKKFGDHRGMLVTWGDEYGLGTMRGIRDMVKEFHDEGFRFAVNSMCGYSGGAHSSDLWWPPHNPDNETAPMAFKFNQLGGDGSYGWYACQHVGVENPAFTRRQYGFSPYRAGLACNFNYAHYLQGWNDNTGTLYKPMMLVYGSGNGCIDTLAWEGFREGQDDIRYATKLQQLAHPLALKGSTEARYAAKLALKLLADADQDDMDLTTLRLEMIRHIQHLMALK